MRRFWAIAAFAAIIVGALILRVYAVGWGLPYIEHPDEPTTAKIVLGMLRRGDWDPRFFEKPSLYYYALRVIFEAHWRYGLASGLYSDISQLPLGTYFYITTPGFFIWGRMLTVLFGVATVILVNAIGRRWWGAAVGLIAAAVLAEFAGELDGRAGPHMRGPRPWRAADSFTRDRMARDCLWRQAAFAWLPAWRG